MCNIIFNKELYKNGPSSEISRMSLLGLLFFLLKNSSIWLYVDGIYMVSLLTGYDYVVIRKVNDY